MQAAVRAREARTVFNAYDRNRSGALELEELQSCLEDLGLMVRTRFHPKPWAVRDPLLPASTGRSCGRA